MCLNFDRPNEHQKLNWSRLLRRGTALALALSMLLPTVAYGTGTPLSAPAKIKADSEFPNIEIQTNFVRSEYGTLEGTMELALRVGPSGATTVTDPDNPDGTVEQPIPVAFRTLSVNLQYDAKLYTPISWSWTGGADTAADLDLDADKAYTVDIPAKKNDLLPATGAIAKCGMTTSADGTKSGEGLVYFKAEAYNSDITLNEMTTLAVIRFKINEPLRSKISILPDGNGGYTVYIDQGTGVDPMVVTDVDELYTSLYGASTTDPATVGFASEDDINKKNPPVNMALHYTGANGQQMYYVPGCRVTDAAGPLPSTVENVTVKINGTDVTLPGPRTINGRVLAVDNDPNVTVATAKYSYLSNHFDEGSPAGHNHITWPVVSDVSFAYQEVDLSKYTTVVYVDWDNTLLGTQILPKRADVREMVNEYVAEHFIYHNADNTETLVPDTVAKVSSLTRADSYRGKYPTTPQALGPNGNIIDDGTVKLEGEKYPLTNKLDYVFFKRPMEATEDATGATVWSQKTDKDGNVIWDAKYPFAYGWAKCTVDNYADTWTTLGMGELSDYNGSSNGGYHKLDSTDLASFTYDLDDFDFELMDFEAGFKSTDNTVFLKAVYEPGTELMDRTNTYRPLKAPYYNKYNTLDAALGGAYEVTVVYERSNMNMTTRIVKGVARMREPVMRQDTTVDMKWESLAAKNVTNDDMVNADNTSAYSNKDKTSYVKVDIPNSEVITASMALSGRNNKLDYYLSDAYGLNFVAAGYRTVPDNDRTDGAVSTYDNYYYYVDGVDESVYYAAPKVENRSGTHGFVLYGTLNNIMELATKYNHGDTASFNDGVSMSTLQDINIRSADGNAVNGGTEDDVRDAIKRAAQAAETAYNNGLGDPQWWNTERNCAELTYHQLQYFILKGTLLPDSTEANFQPEITWCNLHKSCVDQRSDTPDTWDKLIAAAREANGGNTAKMDLLNSLANLENLTKLRKDGNGGHYSTVEELKGAICTAVAALDTTGGTVTHSWDAVQAQILGESATDAPEKYWWYDGVDSVPMNSLADVVTAADAAMAAPAFPATLPDGTQAANRPAKLNQLKPAFDAEVGGNNTNWVKATENLMSQYDVPTDTPDLAGSFDDFRDKLVKAVEAGLTTWGDIQFHILHDRAPAGGTDTTEIAGYWWHNGKSKVVDLKSLVQAAKDANDGDSDMLDALTVDKLYQIKDFHFRSGFNGTTDKYTAANFSDFISGVKEFVKLTNVVVPDSSTTGEDLETAWNQLQYYLIHRDSSMQNWRKERDYYWWRNGADGAAYTLSPGSLDKDVETLMEAAFRSAFNGNPKAYDNLDLTAAEKFRLIPSYGGTEADWASLTKYTDIKDLKDALDALIKETAAGITADSYLDGKYKDIIWRQIQHYLMKGTYLETSDINLPSDDETDKAGYWWRKGDVNPNAGTVKTPIEKFIEAIDNAILNSASDNEIKAIVDESWFADLGIYGGTKAKPILITADSTAAQKNGVKTKLVNLVKNLKGKQGIDAAAIAGGASSASLVDWNVFQYYIYNTITASAPAAGAMKTSAEAKAWLDANVTFPASASLLTMEPNRLMMAEIPAEPVTSTVVGEDGTETTTQSLTEVDGETGVIITTTVTTVVTPQENGVLVVETTTVNTLDPATGETSVEILDTQVVFVPNEENEGEGPNIEDPSSVGGETADSFPVNGEASEGMGPTGGEGSEGEGSDSVSGEGSGGEGSEPTESPAPTESPDPEETDLPDPETPLEPEPTESPEPSESPEPPVESTVTPEETPEPGAGDKTESTESRSPTESPEPTGTEKPERSEPEPSASAEPAQNPEDPPPNVVTTNATSQRRLYRISTRKLKAPPSLRSPNIRKLTTRFVIDRVCTREFILTYGRTPK